MKRLYNEYSAAPYEGNAKHIDMLMTDAFRRVWDEVVLADDVCPRDAESLCHQALTGLFAENILRRAMGKRRLERNTRNEGANDGHRESIRNSTRDGNPSI
jgi:hypothetical protein